MNSSTSNSNETEYSNDANVPYTALPVERHSLIESHILTLAVLVVLAGFITFNGLIFFLLSNDRLNRGQVIVSEKWDLVESATSLSLDYIVLGDSTSSTGFDPDVVHEERKLDGWNLGTIGTFGMIDNVWLLEAYLANNSTPEFVIIIHSFDVLQRDVPTISLLGTYNVPLTQIESLSLADRLQIYQQRLLPIYYRRQSFTNALIGAFQNLPDDLNEVKDNGFLSIKYPMGYDFELAMMNLNNTVSDLSSSVSPMNVEAMRRLIELSEAHDFQLYFVNGPIYEELEANDKLQTIRQHLHESYVTEVSHADTAHYIPDVFTFEKDEMESVDHILPPYTSRYTSNVIMAIHEIHCIYRPDSLLCETSS